MTKLYRQWRAAPITTLEPHYSKHVAAMTSEDLHAKSDIAAELAWRDEQSLRWEAGCIRWRASVETLAVRLGIEHPEKLPGDELMRAVEKAATR